MEKIPNVMWVLSLLHYDIYTVDFFLFSLFFLLLTANARSVHTVEENLCKYLKCQEQNQETIPSYYAFCCFSLGKSVVRGHLMEAAR